MLFTTVGTPWLSVGEQGDVQAGRATVTLTKAGLRNLTIRTAAGATVSGHIVAALGSAQPDLSAMRIRAVPIDGGIDILGSAPVRWDGSFQLKNVFGRSRLQLTGPIDHLWVRSMYVEGRDVTDSGLTVRPGQQIHDVTVELGDPAAALEGTVSNAAGQPVEQAVVLCCPAKRSLWPGLLHRYMRVTRTTSDGRYSIVGLPPEIYLIVAIHDLDLRLTTVPPTL